MTLPNDTERTRTRVGRRAVLLAGAAGLSSTAGCLDLSTGDGPQEHTFTVSITASNGDLSGRVAEAEDVEDVVRVNVEDTVALTFTNETDETVGVHDHATDDSAVIDPGADETIEFEATESMVGRQEIEAWVVEGGEAEGEGGHAHGEDATTIVIVEVRPRGS